LGNLKFKFKYLKILILIFENISQVWGHEFSSLKADGISINSFADLF